MKQNKFTCIACPKSCCITVTDNDGELTFTGYECKRGINHAKNEYLHPMRMLTSTVKVIGGQFDRLGVIGSSELPREKLRDCLKEVYKVAVKAPVKAGDIIIKNILGTGCDIIATMSVEEKN